MGELEYDCYDTVACGGDCDECEIWALLSDGLEEEVEPCPTL